MKKRNLLLLFFAGVFAHCLVAAILVGTVFMPIATRRTTTYQSDVDVLTIDLDSDESWLHDLDGNLLRHQYNDLVFRRHIVYYASDGSIIDHVIQD